MSHTLTLTTDRIELIAADVAILRADATNRPRLSALLDAAVPPDWPPELFDNHQELFAQKMESGEWPMGFAPWYWIHREPGSPRTLFGSGGFYRMPAGDGDIMCGYSIVPTFQGRGLATEAMRALFAWLFDQPGVRRIIGDTFPHLNQSIRVMTKLGMTPTDPGEEAGTIRFALRKQDFVRSAPHTR